MAYPSLAAMASQRQAKTERYKQRKEMEQEAGCPEGHRGKRSSKWWARSRVLLPSPANVGGCQPRGDWEHWPSDKNPERKKLIKRNSSFSLISSGQASDEILHSHLECSPSKSIWSWLSKSGDHDGAWLVWSASETCSITRSGKQPRQYQRSEKHFSDKKSWTEEDDEEPLHQEVQRIPSRTNSKETIPLYHIQT